MTPILKMAFRSYTLFSYLLIGAVLSSGCTSLTQSEPFQTRIYKGTYEQVWLAALKAMNDYPLKLSNKDVGRIESEIINGPYNDLLFTPIEPIELPERFRYAMKVSFGKLEPKQGEPLVRVRIVKALEKFRDFYTGWTPFPTDSLEETLLLYRIEHVLSMDQHLESETQ